MASPVAVSPFDSRKYRAFTLPNALKVLVVSDPLSEQAAVSMDVSVGSFSSPKNLQGLAHFLEHMLFLGTEKYPEEGSYGHFLAENGGQPNAYTAYESTKYHFHIVAAKDAESCFPKCKEALDRFSQLFKSPLFTESAMDRELNAVHSEFQQLQQKELHRYDQVLRHTANSRHPFSGFHSGSKVSLRDIPRAKRLNVRTSLIEFYRKYYSSNLMSLCVVAPYAVDQLQNWVVELFSDIENRNAPSPSEEYSSISPFPPNLPVRKILIESTSPAATLQLSWLIPSSLKHYRSKPIGLILLLFNNMGDGSLSSFLKCKGWALKIQTRHLESRNFGVLHLMVALTKEGFDQMEEIISSVYSYIRLLGATDIPTRIFEDEKLIRYNSFVFHDRQPALDLAVQVSANMQYLRPEEYITGLTQYKEFAPKKIAEILDCMTPRNGHIIVAAAFECSNWDQQETWFGTRFLICKVEDATVQRWTNPARNEEIRLPKPNPYIPTDFSIVVEHSTSAQQYSMGPHRVYETNCMDIHYELDRKFKMPKVSISLQMKTAVAYKSPWHWVMFTLFMAMLEDSLTEDSFEVARAGFYFHFESTTRGPELMFDGYSQRIDDLLLEIVEKVKSFKPNPTRFEILWAQKKAALEMSEQRSPTYHARVHLQSLLSEPNWSWTDQLVCFEDDSISLAAMQKFSGELFRRLFVTALACGNISEESVTKMMKSMKDKLGFLALPVAERPQRAPVLAPKGLDVFSRHPHPNQKDKNSAIEVFYQTGPSRNFRRDALSELLCDILEEPMFHELRTVQQLGYTVEMDVQDLEATAGFSVVIQSTVASPDVLLGRIDDFIAHAREYIIAGMSEEKFSEYVQALIAKKSQADASLFDHSQRFWEELREGHMQYDRADKEIEVLRCIRKRDVMEFFDVYVGREGGKRRRIVCQVFGGLHPFADREAIHENAIEVLDPVAYRRQYVYPE